MIRQIMSPTRGSQYHTFNIAQNLPDRDFTVDRPNQKWAGDISDVPLAFERQVAQTSTKNSTNT